MSSSDTEILFPPRVIPTLKDLRGDAWRELVEKAEEAGPTDPDRLAFVMLMVNLAGCLTCSWDSFRAMRGCTKCARQTVHRVRESDEQLVILFDTVKKDIEDKLAVWAEESPLQNVNKKE